MIKTKPETEVETWERVRHKFIKSFSDFGSKTYPPPTKEDFDRWAKMPDPFADITDAQREEAFKEGFII